MSVNNFLSNFFEIRSDFPLCSKIERKKKYLSK